MIEHIKIGRDLDNNLVVNETEVSNKHAELFKDEESRVFLTDLDSKNGTYVNSKKIEGSIILKRGDHVTIAKTHVVEWENLLFEHGELKEMEVETNLLMEYRFVILIFVLDIIFFTLIMNTI